MSTETKEQIILRAPCGTSERPRPEDLGEGVEPCVTLTYEEEEFVIPYTMIHWWAGWLAAGMKGSHVSAEARKKTRRLFDYLENVMGYDALDLSEEEEAFYAEHGLRRERPTPEEYDLT